MAHQSEQIPPAWRAGMKVYDITEVMLRAT